MYGRITPEVTRNARQSVVYLRKMANLLRSTAFANYYGGQPSRFAWATPMVFARLQKDLMFQVEQLIAHDTPKDAAWGAVAERCEQLADVICQNFGIVAITKKETAFSVPRGTKSDDAVSAILLAFEGRKMPERESSRGFYVINALSSLRIFAEARLTLAKNTGNPIFEKVLLGIDTDWLLAGYPHDLLAHDGRTVRSGAKILEHGLRKDYCCTFMNVEGEGYNELFKATPHVRVISYRQTSECVAA